MLGINGLLFTAGGGERHSGAHAGGGGRGLGSALVTERRISRCIARLSGKLIVAATTQSPLCAQAARTPGASRVASSLYTGSVTRRSVPAHWERHASRHPCTPGCVTRTPGVGQASHTGSVTRRVVPVHRGAPRVASLYTGNVTRRIHGHWVPVMPLTPGCVTRSVLVHRVRLGETSHTTRYARRPCKNLWHRVH